MGRNPQVCSSCTHNCRFFDHFQRTITTSPNSFYRIMFRENFKVLDLPSKLNPTMSMLVDKKIYLEDSTATGKRWAVTVSKVDGSFAFTEGWDVFSLEHKLEIGDLLVFNCINKFNFDVKIYDESTCERLDFSEKRNRKKRSRCSGGSLDVPMHIGTPNSLEVVSENGNVDGRVQSMRTLEDACYITNLVYQNDAAFFNNDPMFEEVLGSGDTSYASKFGLFEREDFRGEVQDCQFTESLGSDQAAISKGKHASCAFEHETSGRNNCLGDSDKSTHYMTSTSKLEAYKEGKSIMSDKEIKEFLFADGLGSNPAAEERCNYIRNILNTPIHIERPKVVKRELNQDNNENRSIMSNGEVQDCQLTASLGSDQAAISKGKHGSDAFELERFGRNSFLGELEIRTYDKTSNLKPEENREGKSIMSEKEIQECQFTEGLGEISEELFNAMTNHIDAQMHIGGMNEVLMNMTPKMRSLNDKLHATESPKDIKGEFNQDDKSHFETAATISCENTKQRFNEMSNLSDDQSHLGEKEEVPMEMTPKLCTFNEKLKATGSPEIVIKIECNEDEADATVTCVVLTDSNYLELSKCLPLSRPGLSTKRMVVLLKDPLERLWPVFYLEQTWLTSGWSEFRRANNIKSGDVCDFRVEDKSKSIVAVYIHHK